MHRKLIPLLTVVTLLVAACAGPTRYRAEGTNRAPGADVLIEVEEIAGGNVLTTVKADYLPPPQRIEQGMNTYAVWFVPQGQAPQLAGALAYDSGRRQGTLAATTMANQFEVRITAEPSTTVEEPSDRVIASRTVSVTE